MIKIFKDTIVIAMGGSLLIPNTIDISFLKKLKEIVKTLIKQDYQIALVIGGGRVCREYQNAAREFNNVSDLDLDWIGIKTIHLNCELVKRSFSDLDVYSDVVLKPSDIKGIKNSLIIVGAWEPGCSSDTDAVEIAENLEAVRIINFSNTSYVYSEDPRINPKAEKFEKLSWSEYRNIIPKKWVPGLSAPFDPIAAQKAEEKGITVAILGASVVNLENYLNAREFEGTILS